MLGSSELGGVEEWRKQVGEVTGNAHGVNDDDDIYAKLPCLVLSYHFYLSYSNYPLK